jgi:parvulin-like peptidyl-prolyl isomerase
MINSVILEENFEKKSIVVGSDEIYETVKRNPPDAIRNHEAFYTDGQFDQSKYLQYLRDPSTDWLTVENYIASSLPSDKLQDLIKSMTFVSMNEARQEFLMKESKVRAKFIRFAASDFANSVPRPSESELESFYKANEKKYVSQDGAVLDYVFVPLEITPKDSAEAKSTIDTLYHMLNQGESFSDLALRFSQDPGSQKNGGDLGWATKGRMVHEFDSVIFALDSGKISTPFLTQFGWHIAMVSGKNDSLKAVHANHILVRLKSSHETIDSVSNLADAIKMDASNGGIISAASKRGLTNIGSSIPVDSKSAVPGLGFYSFINSMALEDTIGAVLDIIASKEGFHIYQVKAKYSKGLPPLTAIREKVLNDYINDRASALAQKAAMDERFRIENDGGVLDPKKFSFDTTGLVSPGDLLPVKGFDPVVAGYMVALPLNKVSKVFKGAFENYYVMENN